MGRAVAKSIAGGVAALSVTFGVGIDAVSPAAAWTNSGGPLHFTTTALACGTRGKPYEGDITVAGGFGNVEFSIAGGRLNQGIALGVFNNAASVDGTPVHAGTSEFKVVATDGAGNSAAEVLSIGINNTAKVGCE